MAQFLQKKAGRFFNMATDLREALGSVCTTRRDFAAGFSFARSDVAVDSVYLIDSGWVFRSKTLENGARQIVNVAIPGDFVNLNGLLFENSEYDLTAKTDVTAYIIPPQALQKMFDRFPAFAMAMFWCHSHEEAMLAQRIVSLGRRSARQRAAHVLSEFIARTEISEFVDSAQVLIPMSQADLADILGLSVVHTNRTLRRLERDGIIAFRDEMLRVIDRNRLHNEAGFQVGYLHFTNRADFVRPPADRRSLVG